MPPKGLPQDPPKNLLRHNDCEPSKAYFVYEVLLADSVYAVFGEEISMKVAVLYFPLKQSKKLQKISKVLADGIESQGHQVDLIDGSRDVKTVLAVYEYVAVGAELPSFFSAKVPTTIVKCLKASSLLVGKRSFAFVLAKPFVAGRALRNLMAVMEAEGMFIKFSEIFADEQLALQTGTKLIIS